jgi:leucyl/phenylalanyl-tRNA--protein transferase
MSDFVELVKKNFIEFPEPDERGLCCIGGDLSVNFLLAAYSQGVFPWFNKDDEPVMWWSLNPRFVLFPSELHVPKRLERFMQQNQKLYLEDRFCFTMDKAFESVITLCSNVKRTGQKGTWITKNMIDAYCQLYKAGWAHSFETWHGTRLAGGFYGVLIGSVFFGESMFTLEDEAAKCCFVNFVKAFEKSGGGLIDCQMYTDNMARYGAKNISRDAFLRLEKELLMKPLSSQLSEHLL